MRSLESATEAAARLLADRFGGTPELSHPEDLGGSGASLVVRARITPTAFLPYRSIVIKQLPCPSEDCAQVTECEDMDRCLDARSPLFQIGAQPAGADRANTIDLGILATSAPQQDRQQPAGPTHGDAAPGQSGGPAAGEFSDDDIALIREVVAYQFTNTLGPEGRPGPQLLAYDLDRRLLILSDAGDGENFSDILTLRGPADRSRALRKLGRALGRMHAVTCDRELAYSTLLRRQCSRHGVSAAAVTGRDIRVGEHIHTGLELLASTGMRINDTVVDLAREAAERARSAECSAFSPFDLTPDNLMMAGEVVILDFEWAGFRDITFDAACVIAGFPQDVTTPSLTDEETDEFLLAWRAEVAPVWPHLRDDVVFADRVLASLIGWAFFSLTLLHYGRHNLRTSGHFDISGEEIQNLTHVHLEDLATTVDAIARYASRHGDPRRDDVVEFAHKLLRVLAESGARPQSRPE